MPADDLANQGLRASVGMFCTLLIHDDNEIPLTPSVAETGIFRESKINTMVADALAPYVARTLATFILTM